MNEIPNLLKILIVEDDESSSQFIELAIRKFAKEIIVTSTGDEAIEICKNHPDLDLIMMDMQLPEMDGYEATRQIRAFNNKVVIIAQTAFALIGDKEKTLEAGCNDYLSKPIRREMLKEIIQKHFGS